MALVKQILIEWGGAIGGPTGRELYTRVGHFTIVNSDGIDVGLNANGASWTVSSPYPATTPGPSTMLGLPATSGYQHWNNSGIKWAKVVFSTLQNLKSITFQQGNMTDGYWNDYMNYVRITLLSDTGATIKVINTIVSTPTASTQERETIFLDVTYALIQDANSKLYNYNGTKIIEIADNTLSDTNFLTNGITDLTAIPESAWTIALPDLQDPKILIWKCDNSIQEVTLVYNCNGFTIPDWITTNESTLLAWTDDTSNTECTLTYNCDNYVPMDLLTDTPVLLKYGDNDDLIENLLNYEVYYAIHINNEYFVYIKNAWKKISADLVYSYGMLSEQLNSLTQTQYDLLNLSNTANISVVGVTQVNDTNYTVTVTNVDVNFVGYYEVGSVYIATNQNYFNTIDWLSIDSATITQTTPTNTDIRYLFSTDGKTYFRYNLSAGWESTTEFEHGMTMEDVIALVDTNWNEILDDELYVLVVFMTNDATESPSLDQFTLGYTKLPTPLTSGSIQIPVPDKGYKNVLTDTVNSTYTLSLADGLAFDDTTVDYNFYTTSDKIHLRPLDMGTMIGGRQQNIFAVEIINAYTDKDFFITLRGTTLDGVVAEEKGNYGLLYDSSDLLGRTKFELSTDANNFNTAVYPLQFNLTAGQRKNVFIRITPTIYNTVGTKQLQLKLTGKPL